MKYTEKQIYKAFLKWETEKRTNPSTFMSESECNGTCLKVFADMLTKELIKNVNK